jgi:phosphonate transport system permease protein
LQFLNPVLISSTSRSSDLRQVYAEARAARRLRFSIGLVVFVLAVVISALVAEVDVVKFVQNASRMTDYLGRIFVLETGKSVWTDVAEWFWGFKKWIAKIGETLLIAYIGTLLGGLGAFVLCFVSARNLGVPLWLRLLMSRILEVCRTVPELVFALTFVIAFGLGPLPGVLALAIHTLGALGKQFAEVVENIDMKPFEGVTSSGAAWTEAVRFAALPQVASNFASYALLRFEYNVRGAAVMGFVGAGGIGQDLLEAIRKFYYSDVSAILILIIFTVMIIDIVTDHIRRHLKGQEVGT